MRYALLLALLPSLALAQVAPVGGVGKATTHSKVTSPVLVVTPSTLPTCGAAGTPEGTIVVVAGATTTPTKVCLCTYTPTGTAYAWYDLRANNAGTGAGNSTTCP